MKLKTLKDLGREFISHTGKRTLERVDVKELKEEAIKEIKLLQEEGEKNHSGRLFRFGSFLIHDDINHRDFFLLIRYIKWKFNITEEDLK